MAVRHYLRFTDYRGNTVTADDGDAQWFEVPDAAFGAIQSVNSGVGVGKVSFAPLTFTLGTSSATTTLNTALAKGTAFRTIELVSYEVGLEHIPRLVSQDVFKLAAVEQNDIDVPSGNQTFTVAYGGRVESVSSFGPGGQLMGTTTAGWDAIRNVADNSLTRVTSPDGTSTNINLGEPVYDPATGRVTDAGVTSVALGGERDLFLQIRNGDGSLLAELGDRWIELSEADLSFLQTVNLSSQSSGSGSGKVAFNPVSLSFNPGALSPILQQILAQGKALQVEIAAYGPGYKNNSANLLDVYQFGLAAFAESAAKYEGDELSHTYLLEYGSERITHMILDPDTGVPTGQKSVSGWDRVRNVEINKNTAGLGAIHALPTAEEAVANRYAADVVADHYYLRFTDYQGNVLHGDDDRAQWFELADFSFGATQELRIGAQATGTGAGKVSLENLTFTLESSKAASVLDTMLARGTPFRTVELVGYDKLENTDVARLVSQNVFKFAAIESDRIDVGSGHHVFTLAYGGHVESVTTYKPSGTPGGTTTAGWDRTANRADDSLTSIIGPRGGDASLGPSLYDASTGKLNVDSVVAKPSDSSLDHYLQIRNADGSTLNGLDDKWINITEANLAFLQTLNVGSTGTGAGKVSFGPLSLSFDAGSFAPYLFQAQAKGTTLQLEIASYGHVGNLKYAGLVDSYQFGLGAVKTVNQYQTEDGMKYSYNFEYGTQRITHFVNDETTNKPIKASVTGWDRLTNTVMTGDGDASSGKAVGPIRAPDQNPEAGLLLGTGRAKDFYVRFKEADGTILKGDNGTAQWFEVSDLSFSSEQLLNIGSQGSGSGAGKVELLPLSFTLNSSGGATQLDNFLAKGTPFKTIELIGYSTAGASWGQQALYLSTFKLAAVRSDAINAMTGEHSLSFDYGALVSQITSFEFDGTPVGGIPIGWNRINNTVDDSPSDAISVASRSDFATRATQSLSSNIKVDNPPVGKDAIGAEGGASDSPGRLYLQIRNADGTLLREFGENWIEVNQAELSFEQLISLGSQSGGVGAGKVTFNPLTLGFKAGALGPILDQALAQGRTFQIELARYTDSLGGKLVLLDDYQFGAAVLTTNATSVDESGTLQIYTFEYDTQRTTHSLLGSKGQVMGTSVTGWDRTTNTQQLGDTTASGNGVGKIHAPAEAEGLVFYTGAVNGAPTPVPIPTVTVVLAHDTAPDIDASDAPTRSDHVTSDPTLQGTSTVPGNVRVFEGDTLIGTAKVGSDGKWMLSPPLSDGMHTLTVSQANSAGEIGRSAIAINVDTLAPDTEFALTPEILSKSSIAQFVFSGADGMGSGIAKYAYSLDGAAYVSSGSALSLQNLSDGEHTLRIKTQDSAGNVDGTPASFTWTVDTNNAPLAQNLSLIANEDERLSGSLLATDADNNTLAFMVDSDPKHGTLTLNSNGTFTYTPNANFSGTDSFTYWASDGRADSAVATVNLVVNPVNDPILAPFDVDAGDNRVAENAAIGTQVGLRAQAIDIDDAPSGTRYSLVDPTGEFAIDALTGVVTVAGPIDFEAGASRSLTIRATSQDGTSATTGFTVAVTDVDEVAPLPLPLQASAKPVSYVTLGGADDTFEGDRFANYLNGGGGRDTASGGAGDDTYAVEGAGDTVIEKANEGIDTVESYGSYVLSANVENLKLVGLNLTGVGNELANAITGGRGNDILNGKAGNDYLTGGAGGDTFVFERGTGHDVVTDFAAGSAGTDIVKLVDFGFASFAQVQAAMTQVGSDVQLKLADATYVSFLNHAIGDFTADDFGFVTPPTQAPQPLPTQPPASAKPGSYFYGTAGNDTLDGNQYANFLNGYGGQDATRGGLGDDTYGVENQNDTVIEFANEGIDTVESYGSYALSANVENLKLLGISLTGTGNELANRIVGGTGNDVLNGKAGNDYLTGGAGGDTFVFERGTGHDVITDFAAGSSGSDVVNLRAFSYSSFDQIKAGMLQDGENVQLKLQDGSYISFLKTSIGLFDAGDFVL